MYLNTYTGTASGTRDTGGLSTDLMVTLGVGIVTLATINTSFMLHKETSE